MSFKDLTDLVSGICQDTFSEDSTYSRAGSSSITVRAVFEQEWIEVNGVSTTALVARVVKQDFEVLSRPKAGDTITKGDTTYTVKDVREDSYESFFLTLRG